jgi:hypothetical protein
MCDQDEYEKARQDYEARGLVTRRQFGVLLGAGMTMAGLGVGVSIYARSASSAEPCTRP